MSSTNKTSLGLNMWEASDKPVRQDFVNDNVIINEKITKLNSDITIKSIGNAISAPRWTVTASNLVMNGIGMVYGTITHNANTAPAWGELVATFPNFSSRYNIPVLLFVTSGTIYVTANISQVGELKLYGPDFEKLNIKDKVYHFNAIYYAGK